MDTSASRSRDSTEASIGNRPMDSALSRWADRQRFGEVSQNEQDTRKTLVCDTAYDLVDPLSRQCPYLLGHDPGGFAEHVTRGNDDMIIPSSIPTGDRHDDDQVRDKRKVSVARYDQRRTPACLLLAGDWIE
jgi:hypothetical protein